MVRNASSTAVHANEWLLCRQLKRSCAVEADLHVAGGGKFPLLLPFIMPSSSRGKNISRPGVPLLIQSPMYLTSFPDTSTIIVSNEMVLLFLPVLVARKLPRVKRKKHYNFAPESTSSIRICNRFGILGRAFELFRGKVTFLGEKPAGFHLKESRSLGSIPSS